MSIVKRHSVGRPSSGPVACVDPKTGDLYTGDVGWQLWEMLYRVQRGANYGWSLTEGGRQDVRPDRVVGPSPVLPPLVIHSHEEAASITGGEFYHGSRLPEHGGERIVIGGLQFDARHIFQS